MATKNIIPELLSLKDLATYYQLSPGTIKRERWEQKAVRQNKMKPEDVRNLDGFGYKVDSVKLYRKIYYKREDVEAFIAEHVQQSPMKQING